MHTTQLNAIELANTVRKRIVDFTASDLFVRDADLTACLREMWNAENSPGNLVSDLWVEGAFPPVVCDDTLSSLVSEGCLQPALRDTLLRNKVFPEDLKLYKHQSESLRCAHAGFSQAEKPAVVVTAGTGAGKTESFLFPLLNNIFSTTAQSGGGVSAIILYPMNALVNDQVERLYNWLKGQNIATLFHFTSETPEDSGAANRANIPRYDACRYRTRRHARGLEDIAGKPTPPANPGPVPRILITNYSMLEYMLCRPQDAVFFGKNLRSIVLDEAHLYTGTLAAEITLLLRRLLLRCGLNSKNVLQFATSATLGTGGLKEFIGKLFTKSPQLVHYIEGKSRRTQLSEKKPPLAPPAATDIASLAWPDAPLIHADNTGNISLRDAKPDELKEWQQCLAVLVAERHIQSHVVACDSQPARLLHATLGASPIIHELERVLWTKNNLPLRDLAQELFGGMGKTESEATRRLLQLCAAARESATGQPLIGNRIHFLIRASQGFTVFFDNKRRKTGVAWGKIGFTLVPGHHDRCSETGVIGLTLARCKQCGSVYFTGNENKGKLGPVPPQNKMSFKVLRCVKSNESLTDEQQRAITLSFVFQPADGKISGEGAEGIKLHEVNKCLECFAEPDQIHALVASHYLLRNILAETMLAAMPEKPGDSRLWLPARGRRLLVFSDSRSSAARLGPSLTRQHAIQLIRAAIVRHAPAASNEAVIARLRARVKDARKELGANPPPELRVMLEQEIRADETTLLQAESGGAISTWVAAIQDSPLVAELFDVEKSEKDTAEKWQQTDWEKHQKDMISYLDFFIMRELAPRPSWPNISLETLGLVEVVYPGVEKLSCPDGILGKLPQDIAHRFETNWPTLMASLLDSLRTDRAITLGGDLYDALYSDYSPVPIGRWFSVEDSFQSTLVALAGKTVGHRRNAFLATLLRGKTPFDATQRDALVLDVFRAGFDQLRNAAEKKNFPWLQFEQRQTENGAATSITHGCVETRIPPSHCAVPMCADKPSLVSHH